MELNIQIPESVLEELFASGALHPNQIKCFHSESKERIRSMCLSFCTPNHCHTCDMREHCEKDVTPEQGTPSENRLYYRTIDLVEINTLN